MDHQVVPSSSLELASVHNVATMATFVGNLDTLTDDVFRTVQ
jgi:hypothetical protein